MAPLFRHRGSPPRDKSRVRPALVKFERDQRRDTLHVDKEAGKHLVMEVEELAPPQAMEVKSQDQVHFPLPEKYVFLGG